MRGLLGRSPALQTIGPAPQQAHRRLATVEEPAGLVGADAQNAEHLGLGQGGVSPLHQQLGEGIDVVVMLATGKGGQLFDEVFHPHAIGPASTVRPRRPREIDVARGDPRFARRRAGKLAPFRWNRDQSR